MPTSWKAVLRGATLLALLVLAGLPSAFADDPSSPYEPPEARIKPPTGVTSEHARMSPSTGAPTTSARIHPTGDPQPNARIKPPTGEPEEPTWSEQLMEWLRGLAGIHPPIR